MRSSRRSGGCWIGRARRTTMRRPAHSPPGRRNVRLSPSGFKMAKTAAKKPAKQTKASKPAKKAPPAKSAHVQKEAARQEAARGKLERVKVPSPSRRDDESSGKYVYCVIRS